MKKIVALVLSLVMVLGLATTAFAGTFADVESLEGIAGYEAFSAELKLKDAAEKNEFATYEVIMVAKKAVEFDGKKYDKGEDFTLEVNNVDEFIVVAAADADFAIVDGKKVTFLAAVDGIDAYENGWAEKAQKVELPFAAEDKMDCHAYYAATEDGTVFYRYDGVFYKAVADDDFDAEIGYVFNVDGVAVLGMPADVEAGAFASATDIFYSGHAYELDMKKDSNGIYKPDTVWCDANGVKETFQFKTSKSDAIAAWGEYGFETVVFDNEWTLFIKWDEPTNWTVIGGASAGTAGSADGETVTSPKTFDAGIAMYVGMSVMAAAGSAVVLKKKD